MNLIKRLENASPDHLDCLVKEYYLSIASKEVIYKQLQLELRCYSKKEMIHKEILNFVDQLFNKDIIHWSFSGVTTNYDQQLLAGTDMDTSKDKNVCDISHEFISNYNEEMCIAYKSRLVLGIDIEKFSLEEMLGKNSLFEANNEGLFC